MLSVPNYEHCRAYIVHRVQALASSPSLAGHYGEIGERWNDRPWTTELPSDNQIILHMLSVWLSFFMCGSRAAKVELVFNQKHLFVRREVHLEAEEIALCTDDYATFWVRARWKSPELQTFYATPGRDAMYAGLTLFFWFVKQNHDYMLGGADLKEAPISMHTRVFAEGSFV
jgi:hypothetical protein